MICRSGTTPMAAGCDEQPAAVRVLAGGVMRPTGDGTGGDLAHIWLLPAEEQVDEQPADMVAAARASDARQSK